MSDCIEWTGTTNNAGYGSKWLDGRMVLMHRVAVAEIHGWDAIEGKVVMHACDNPPCINPDHLRIGTHADNMADAARKGRLENSQKTHCPHGHEYTDENTRIGPSGGRWCRACAREHSRQYRLRQKGLF